MKKFPLSIVIAAVDRASGPMARATAKIDRGLLRLSMPVLKLQRAFGNLSRNAGLDRIGLSLKNSAVQARAFGSALGGALSKLVLIGAAGVAIGGSLLHGFASAGESALMTSKKLGVGVEWLQEWQYAARQAGLEGETFANGTAYLSRQIAEAAAGKGPAVDAFNALGIAMKTAEGRTRPLPEVLDETITKLGGLEDANLRNALAARIFGRSAGMEMAPLLEEGAEKLDAYRKRARELGIVLSEDVAQAGDDYLDTLDELKSAGAGARNAFFSAALPVITAQLQRLTAWIVTNREKIAAWGKVLAERIPAAIERAGAALRALWEGAQPVVNFLQRLADRFGGARLAAIALALVIFGPVLLAAASLLLALGGLTVGIGRTIAALFSLKIGSMTAGAHLKAFGVTIWTKTLPALGAFAAALMANPLTWIVIGVTAAVAALVYFREEIWAFLKVIGGAIATGMQAIGGWLIWPFDKAWTFLKGFVSWIPDAIGGALDWVVEKFRWLTSWLPDWITGGGPIEGDMRVTIGDQEISPVGGGLQRQETHVRVSLGNAPPGTRIQGVSGDAVPLDVDVGYARNTFG